MFYSVIAAQQNLILYPFYLVNFGVHEVTHVATSGLPDLLTAASGSLMEIVLAILLIIAGISTRSFFAAAMMLVWLSFSFFSAGAYMADARAQELDLVSVSSATGLSKPSDNIHDWEYVFNELGIIEHDLTIGKLMNGLGILSGLIGLSLGAWMIYGMIRPQYAMKDESAKPDTADFTADQTGVYPQMKQKRIDPMPPSESDSYSSDTSLAEEAANTDVDRDS